MTSAGTQDDDVYAFLAVYDGATLRFDLPASDARAVVGRFREVAEESGLKGDPREFMRGIVRDGILDGNHIHPTRSQNICNALVWLCLTNEAYQRDPDRRGFIVEITDQAPGQSNFRFMLAPDGQLVDEFTEKLRKGRKYVASYTDEEVAKAARRKKVPIPKDPNLEAPSRPRPERWLQDLERAEKDLGKEQLATARRCMEDGALFVWRSRQLADAAQEDIDASLGAMAEYGRLRLPYASIWAETRDWIEVPMQDAPAKRLPARLAMAAFQDGETISFWGFADIADQTSMSILRADVDQAALQDGSRGFRLHFPEVAPGFRWDEGLHRRIAFACGDRLLELLFLLSTAGVAKEQVQGVGGKPGKKSKAQRRQAQRGHTIVRVPLSYQPGSSGSGDGAGGRWVRPHVRRAHMWGKNTRPLDEQHWREATLVGAAKADEVEIPRPEYRIG